MGCVVLALGVVVGWAMLPETRVVTEEADSAIFEATTPTPMAVDTSMPTPATTSATVQYTDTGFVPAFVTVKQGSTVTFVNDASSGMWVASAMHPTHSLLPGFDELKSVTRGGTYEYMFTNVGTWKYHNHVNPTATGTVIVVQ